MSNKSKTTEIILPKGCTGMILLNHALYNKGTAFTEDERQQFLLHGLLPSQIESLDKQTKRMYQFFQTHTTALEKHLMLRKIANRNKVLFFNLIFQNLEEMLPIIYTPTIGEAVTSFPLHDTPRGGLYLPKNKQHVFDKLVANSPIPQADIIVITDGSAILGIGDQGMAGIDICIAKLMVYTLCGGISPYRTLPVVIDVGTNNEQLLENPLYQGCQSERLTGIAYESVIDNAIAALKKRYPNALFHWEDFDRNHAQRHLDHHQKNLCTFNDDIQGTGAVTLATISTACRANHSHLIEQTYLIFGAGTAGIGIADRIFEALTMLGLSHAEAQDKIWLIDRDGLVTHNLSNLTDGQRKYAKDPGQINDWMTQENSISLLHHVIKNVEPTVLIGCSAVSGAFDKAAIQHMLTYMSHPIILPLSNPTDRCEATPKDLIYWTNGRARVATGSPFPSVDYHGQGFVIAQCNNAMIYPGIGLGCAISNASRITEKMIWAASEALSESTPNIEHPGAALLPTLSSIQETSAKIAYAIAKQAVEEKVATHLPSHEEIIDYMWQPHYPTFIQATKS